MAAVQNMTLNEQETMYSVIQHSPQTNCVIVSSDHSAKSVIQAKRPLAPAPDHNTVVYTNAACKKKIQFMTYGSTPQQPVSVARRNARERNRVKQVNNGFAALRQHIPANVLTAFGALENTASAGRSGSKKLSKVETLRVAVEYIKSLQKMLEEHEADVASKNIINAIVENRFFPGSPDSVTQQYSPYPLALPTPPASESSASPTPSHTSETSYPPTTVYVQDSFKTFDAKGPDDEELLDAIFSWQQTE